MTHVCAKVFIQIWHVRSHSGASLWSSPSFHSKTIRSTLRVRVVQLDACCPPPTQVTERRERLVGWGDGSARKTLSRSVDGCVSVSLWPGEM